MDDGTKPKQGPASLLDELSAEEWEALADDAPLLPAPDVADPLDETAPAEYVCLRDLDAEETSPIEISAGSRPGGFLDEQSDEDERPGSLGRHADISLRGTPVAPLTTTDPSEATTPDAPALDEPPEPRATSGRRVALRARYGEGTDPLDSADEATLRPLLALLCDLTTRLERPDGVTRLCRALVHHLVVGIPGATAGAVLFGEDLRLKAHEPGSYRPRQVEAQASANMHRAFLAYAGECHRCGFESDPGTRWCVHCGQDLGEVKGDRAALFAPLLWRQSVLGVLVVECEGTTGSSGAALLRVLQAVASQTAAVLVGQERERTLVRLQEAVENFRTLTPPAACELVMSRRGRLRLGGEYEERAVLFADLRGFTRVSATLPPDAITGMLEAYFGGLVPLIVDHGGAVDKYVGDAILAVFPEDDKADKASLRAVRTAAAMQRELAEVNRRRATRKEPTCELGVGVHFGLAMVGLIGTQERMEHTVIGDTVNRASRYCDGAAGGEVVISPEVHERVWHAVETELTSIPTKHEGELAAYLVTSVEGEPL